MIFTEDIETMQFGLIEGKEYNIFKGNKKASKRNIYRRIRS